MRTTTAIGLVLALGLGVAAVGCGGSGGGSGYGAPAPAPSPPPPPAPSGCTGGTPTALTVKNYLDWCSLSVAGRAPSAASSQTVCVATGPVALAATALPGFILGPAPWHDTDGDHGSGDPASVTTVTVSTATDCVWACCPFPDGSGCPATDQCP